jgi:hypothetical protein
MKLNHYMAFLKVAINEHDGGRISGRVYSQRLKEPIDFNDTGDLLLQIEELLDLQDFPRAFQRKRTFGGVAISRIKDSALPTDNEEGNMDEDSVNSAKGDFATFTINVITRQNASWQGYLDWLDGSEKQPFDSDLELLALIKDGLDKE